MLVFTPLDALVGCFNAQLPHFICGAGGRGLGTLAAQGKRLDSVFLKVSSNPMIL